MIAAVVSVVCFVGAAVAACHGDADVEEPARGVFIASMGTAGVIAFGVAVLT